MGSEGLGGARRRAGATLSGSQDESPWCVPAAGSRGLSGLRRQEGRGCPCEKRPSHSPGNGSAAGNKPLPGALRGAAWPVGCGLCLAREAACAAPQPRPPGPLWPPSPSDTLEACVLTPRLPFALLGQRLLEHLWAAHGHGVEASSSPVPVCVSAGPALVCEMGRACVAARDGWAACARVSSRNI